MRRSSMNRNALWKEDSIKSRSKEWRLGFCRVLAFIARVSCFFCFVLVWSFVPSRQYSSLKFPSFYPPPPESRRFIEIFGGVLRQRTDDGSWPHSVRNVGGDIQLYSFIMRTSSWFEKRLDFSITPQKLSIFYRNLNRSEALDMHIMKSGGGGYVSRNAAYFEKQFRLHSGSKKINKISKYIDDLTKFSYFLDRSETLSAISPYNLFCFTCYVGNAPFFYIELPQPLPPESCVHSVVRQMIGCINIL